MISSGCFVFKSIFNQYHPYTFSEPGPNLLQYFFTIYSLLSEEVLNNY